MYERGEERGRDRILRVTVNDAGCEPEADPENNDQGDDQHKERAFAVERENAGKDERKQQAARQQRDEFPPNHG